MESARSILGPLVVILLCLAGVIAFSGISVYAAIRLRWRGHYLIEDRRS